MSLLFLTFSECLLDILNYERCMVWQIGSDVIFWKQFLGFWISFQLARLERICGLRREVAGSGRPIMLIDGPSFQREDLVLTVGLLPLSIEIKGIPKSVASISDISCFTFFFWKVLLYIFGNECKPMVGGWRWRRKGIGFRFEHSQT